MKEDDVVIQVLIAEDSPVQEEFLRFLLEQSGDFKVVGAARDGAEVMHQTKTLRPDIILMDCYMPGIDGLEATRLIMKECPTPIVLASAALTPREAEITFDAMRHGALAVVEKPKGVDTPSHERMTKMLLRTLRLMSEIKVVGRRVQPAAAKEAAKRKVTPAGPIAVIAMGGSTGAPGVIADILESLGSARPAPILIVQHLTEKFVDRWAEWLNSRTCLTVRLAQGGVAVERGSIYVAPDGAQMGISASGCIELTDDPADDGFRPSATHLFRSVANAYGPCGMGILLTGMGQDGATGLLALRQAGGHTIVQDRESCVVFGMPGTAVKLGAAMDVLPPPAIAKLILSSQPGKAEKADANPDRPHAA